MPKTDSSRLSSKPQSKHKSGWVIPVIALFCLGPLLFLALIVLGTGLGIQGSIGGFGGMQMATAQYTPKDVVGDLGGMPVTIPRHMAEFVEYEGDPGWGQKRKGPIPERTHESKLTSFGVQFRYPDMATLSSPAMWQDKNSKSIYNTDWMSFGVDASSQHPDAWVKRLADANINGLHASRYIYVRQAKRVFGLEAYLRVNKDTLEPEERMSTITGDSIYIKRNQTGEITTYIECSTVQHFAAPCSHNFGLEFIGIKAKIDIGYRRPLLENWQDIQAKVSEMVLGFKHIPTSSDTPQTNSPSTPQPVN